MKEENERLLYEILNEVNPDKKEIKFAVWCETCQDWKTEFYPDPSNIWILCNDCNDGIIKVIYNNQKI